MGGGGSGSVSGGKGTRRSWSRSPLSSAKRKRSHTQLSACGDENGPPSPFPSDGPKNTSRALSQSQLVVHQDGAYMQVIFDETHRFACDDDTPDLPPLPSTASAGDGAADAVNKGMGPAAGGDEVNRTGNGRSKGGRNDIDQALSLLQLSGGSGGVPQLKFARADKRLYDGAGGKS
ncbi:unnamed protein product, partial [Sphacelaria rigidula]